MLDLNDSVALSSDKVVLGSHYREESRENENENWAHHRCR